MIRYEILRPADTVGLIQKEIITNFLYANFEEFLDKKEDILKALDYALGGSYVSHAGFVILAKDNAKIVACMVVNKTGMVGYLPDNILVYMAVAKDYRGKGIGTTLVKKLKTETKGSIGLYLPEKSDIKKFFAKMGFVSKFIEMRMEK
jgi:[ribosomal protein S18]-alanine N-acetyltransferase